MKQRVITATILFAICIPLLILGGYYLSVAIAIIGCFAGYELVSIKSKAKDTTTAKQPLFIYVLTFLGIIGLLFFNFDIIAGKVVWYFDLELGSLTKIGFSLINLAIFFVLLLCSCVVSKRFKIADAFYLFTMIVVLTFGLQSFIYLRSLPLNPNMEGIAHYQGYGYEGLNGIYLSIYLLVTTMMTDTGAYIGGMLFRKSKRPVHLLIERVSPKKTVEGAVVGTLCGTLFGSLVFGLLVNRFEFVLPWYVILLLTFALTIMAQFGDLIFSCIKRHFQVKDFSNLLPGHGGVLDRLDSLIFNSILLGTFIFVFVQNLHLLVG